MNGFWVLSVSFLIGISSAASSSFSISEISITPLEQIAKEYEDITIDCIHFGNGKVHWTRKDGSPLPKYAKQFRGRLSINRIKFSDAGYYVCIPEDGSPPKEAFVKVIQRRKATKYTIAYESTTSGLGKTVAEVSTPFPVFSTVKTEVTPYPCIFGLCNGTCCGISVEAFFDCANGQKINKSLVCNQHNDCEDGSDEAKCAPWPPKITVLPSQKVEVFCGDEVKSKAGVLVLECGSVGHPVPLIKWKKYDGHVPSKCVQTSQGGRGRLECPDFQQSDQGAYSCVAENSLKSAQSQPRSVAKCSNIINCRGFKVVNEDKIEHCFKCFCSGKTSQCQSIKSNLTLHEFPFPSTKTEVFAADDGHVIFVPTKNKLTPEHQIRESAKEVTYCSLSGEDMKETSFLKSFGRNIVIPRFKGKSNFLPKAPDIIIQGNNLSLIYTFNTISPNSGNPSGVSVRFWPGNWHHVNKKPANREDLMKVLSNVNSLLLRCEYIQGEILNLSENPTIFLESSAVTNFTNSVSYVEKCNCPVGYDGLSCESCAEGYTKKFDGSDFTCEKIYVPLKDCKLGYVGLNCTECDEFKGYVKQGDECVKFTCDPIGSISAVPNSSGKCTCREGVTGDFCGKCKKDHFYLQKNKGCSKCWCSGITHQCYSSKLFRTAISKTPYGGYNSSDGRNFWLLPLDFSGNRLTSYGGYLNFTMTYKPGIPKENTYLTVELLSIGDDTLVYTHPTIDRSTLSEEKSWSVPINENSWKKPDKSSITRGEFLSVLSKIKAIYIESPYHLSSGQANLTSTRMSSATPYGDDESESALEVEQCNCPAGYSGLSCESCSEGYYKKRNGSITQCLKCNCTYCDPEFGCPDCPGMTYRDNPEDEKMPVCKPCPCNNNALGCFKDDYNQIICRCKASFTGMHCEKTMTEVADHDLTLKISPRRIRNKRVGSEVSFTCSYTSHEDMIMSAQKTFGKNYANSLLSPHINSENESAKNNTFVKNYKVVLEDGLEFLECFVHDVEGKLAGHIRAVVEDLITVVKPVKITNCYSTVTDVKESESKDLICKATGSPPPMITWYRSNNKNKTAEKVDTADGVHYIESASLDQNGTVYTCIAENSEGDKATCSKVLIVKKKCEIVTILPSEVKEEEGRNISLLCKTSAKSNVTWSRLNRLLPFESSVENGFLKITKATVSDSGTYVCTAQGQDGRPINNTVTVTVKEKKVPPSVVIPDDDKTIHVGDFFEVKCIGFGHPAPTVTWRRRDGFVDANVLIRGNTLTINKATVQNTGIYVCEGLSELGNATAYIFLEVRQKIIPPTVTVSEENIKAHEGEEVTVTCIAKGYPQPSISWYTPGINNTNFKRSQNSSVSTESLSSTRETLTFKVTQDMDGKNLICSSPNGNNSVKAGTKITVLHSKDSTNETIEFARLGSYFHIFCGSIHDNVSWEKSGGLLGDECKVLNGLMFETIQVQHNGTYICKTQSNSVQIIHLIVVGFVPKFSQSLRSYMVLPVHLHSPGEIRLEISFHPTKENGLLLHRENHLLDLYLKGGKIHLGVYSKDGDFFDIVMKEPIQLRKWYLLIVSIRPQYVDITIYNEKSFVFGRKTEHLKDLNINVGSGQGNFFVGGSVPSVRTRHPEKIFFSRFASFDGCMSKLRINNHEVDFVKESSYSEKVHLCNVCLEEPNLCQGKGKCLEAPTQYGFICVCPRQTKSKKSTCPASCSGKGCETQLNFCKLLTPCSGKVVHKCINQMSHLQCDCAYGYSGATCERVVEYSFCTKGVGYVRLPNLFERHLLNLRETIKIVFTANEPDGMLLWQGDKNNHLSISVDAGKLKYIYQNQNSALTVTSARNLPLEEKVDLMVIRSNNTVFLQLSLQDETKTLETYKNFTRFTTNRVSGDIYLGNVPSSMRYKYKGLNGCIHYIAFRDKRKIDLRDKELERMNTYFPQNPELEQDSEEYDSDEIVSNDSDPI